MPSGLSDAPSPVSLERYNRALVRGSLRGSILNRVNLQKADLAWTNSYCADLSGANLTDTILPPGRPDLLANHDQVWPEIKLSLSRRWHH